MDADKSESLPSASVAKTLTVVIPCYNEAATIEGLLERVHRSGVTDLEVIVVDDFSTDGTREKLSAVRERGEMGDVRLVFHERNMGKGAALRSGFQSATGDIVVVQDADLEYDPQEYAKLIEPILEGKADVVYGSRFAGGESHRVLYYWHSVGNKFLTLMSNMATNLNLTDMETCFKAFRREVIQSIKLEEDRFGFEPEVTAKVARKGCRIFEVGISYAGRTYAEGKKIGWRDGMEAIWCIVKYNFLR